MFERFEQSMIDTGEVTIRVRHGGSGPPLLLLHGHPHTHTIWYKVAPRLAEHFTVVAADLRGYGQSSKPTTAPDHEPYSKRAMARDQVSVMRHLGFNEFFVAGHDRGGRCGYRLALDFPDNVLKLAVLDIIPTGEAFRRANMEFGLVDWHWFFLAQPADFPEHLINSDPDYFYWKRHRNERPSYVDEEPFEDWRRAWHDPDTVHAMCEDYRAGATYDYKLDEADRGKHRIGCPVHVLWAGRDELGKWYDVLDVWGDWADAVSGRALDCSHNLQLELPDETYEELFNFFSR